MCELSWLQGPSQITSEGSQGSFEICTHSLWLNGDFLLIKSLGCPQAFLWAKCNLFTLSTAVSYLLMKTCSIMAVPVKGLSVSKHVRECFLHSGFTKSLLSWRSNQSTPNDPFNAGFKVIWMSFWQMFTYQIYIEASISWGRWPPNGLLLVLTPLIKYNSGKWSCLPCTRTRFAYVTCRERKSYCSNIPACSLPDVLQHILAGKLKFD